MIGTDLDYMRDKLRRRLKGKPSAEDEESVSEATEKNLPGGVKNSRGRINYLASIYKIEEEQIPLSEYILYSHTDLFCIIFMHFKCFICKITGKMPSLHEPRALIEARKRNGDDDEEPSSDEEVIDIGNNYDPPTGSQHNGPASVPQSQDEFNAMMFQPIVLLEHGSTPPNHRDGGKEPVGPDQRSYGEQQNIMDELNTPPSSGGPITKPVPRVPSVGQHQGYLRPNPAPSSPYPSTYSTPRVDYGPMMRRTFNQRLNNYQTPPPATINTNHPWHHGFHSLRTDDETRMMLERDAPQLMQHGFGGHELQYGRELPHEQNVHPGYSANNSKLEYFFSSNNVNKY